MNEMLSIIAQYQSEIWKAIGETFIMVGTSIAAAVLLGFRQERFCICAAKGKNMKIDCCSPY